jgi:hypothetical protein
LEIGSLFLPLAWNIILLFMLPCFAGMTGMNHYAQPLVKMGSLELFAQVASNYDHYLTLWSK